jgi:hypothetical protein
MHYLTYVLVPENPHHEEYDNCCWQLMEQTGLVPEGTNHIGAHVSDLLAPYDEGLKVAPYEVTCYCAEHRADEMAGEEADQIFGPLPKLLPFIKRSTGEPLDDEYPREERFRFMDERVSQILPTLSPDPNCDECRGSGKKLIRDNPHGKYDWWTVGEGFTAGILKPAITENSITPAHEDMVPVKDLELEKVEVPYSVITPDGVWHEDPDRFETSTEESQLRWVATAKGLLARHEDCTVVAVNCHT